MYTINHINVNDELMHEIEQNLNKLYFSTERGRVYISESVNTFIHELNTLLNNVLHISFNPYQE